MSSGTSSDLMDYRCMITGVGLLGAECGCVVLAQTPDAAFVPITLPLWGRYTGHGAVEDIHEGPGADLILGGLQGLQQSKHLRVNWATLGVEPQPLDHIEAVLGILALAHIHAPSAVQCQGRVLRFALLSGHVAAALMAEEPVRLPHDTPIEQLPEVVFNQDPLASTLYAPLAAQSVRLRCRFGLILAGFAALDDGLLSRNLRWSPPGEATIASAAASERWLAHALAQASDDPVLLAGLSEHLSAGSEEEEEEESP